jgi:hypothetical protein
VAERLEQLVAAWLDEMWADPDYATWAREELRTAAAANAQRDIKRELDALVAGFTVPTSCPEEVADSARMAASLGFPLDGVHKSYRVGHAVQWRAWEEAVYALAEPEDRTRALLELGSDFFFEYGDRCCKWAALAYADERERLLRGEEQRRTQLVRALLAGEERRSEDLGYELDQTHLALIAWGAEPEATLDAAAEELGGELLRIALDRETAWGWLGYENWTSEREASLRRVVPPEGARLAAGGPASGAAGFRQAHDEARQARRVAARGAQPICLYDDLGLLALVLEDESRARAFCARELGTLGEDGERAHDLRETLRAYLATAHQASSAAALLGVHERTVANRIRAVEERLGRPVAARSAELDVALRVWALLCRNP